MRAGVGIYLRVCVWVCVSEPKVVFPLRTNDPILTNTRLDFGFCGGYAPFHARFFFNSGTTNNFILVSFWVISRHRPPCSFARSMAKRRFIHSVLSENFPSKINSSFCDNSFRYHSVILHTKSVAEYLTPLTNGVIWIRIGSKPCYSCFMWNLIGIGEMKWKAMDDLPIFCELCPQVSHLLQQVLISCGTNRPKNHSGH